MRRMNVSLNAFSRTVFLIFFLITPLARSFVLICPLAPLAPVWVVGKAAIMTRKKLWPKSEPWPKEWEQNDIWFENKDKIKDESRQKVTQKSNPSKKEPSSTLNPPFNSCIKKWSYYIWHLYLKCCCLIMTCNTIFISPWHQMNITTLTVLC